jgi:hypothetical protein
MIADKYEKNLENEIKIAVDRENRGVYWINPTIISI